MDSAAALRATLLDNLAREMARVIHQHIKRPLADHMLFGALQKGGVAEVDVEGEDGAELTLRVLEVHDDHVMVDANHPFAGMDLAFTVDVVSVRAVR